ncbi:PspC domain-containing protein [Streptomyces sp. NPDC005805]|uniref:PspC domain-containing protein n=1 Tax=Streptomyces sp. NPDC005805 TaxID=3157068 RepID=UPI0033D3BF2A
MSQPTAAPPPGTHEDPPAPARQPLRRSTRNKLVAGVCGGLGRHCDVDPVIFRVVIGVLSATGGIGLIFYGFAWLLVPAADEDETEFRRLLTGRVDRASLSAVLLALIGCGLLLTTLGNADMLAFASMLALTTAGVAVWSQRRALATDEGAGLDPATAHAVAEAPPETKAPPAPDSPSWWRDPIHKDGTTGPVATGYLWGPEDAVAEAARDRRPPGGGPAAPRPEKQQARGRRGIGGPVVLLAVIAAVVGTATSWDGRPLGDSLQIGAVAALAVLGTGLLVSSLIGRTGLGTVLATLAAAGVLAGATALPPEIGTDFRETVWKPASVSAVEPRYDLGSGAGTLDLSAVQVPAGETLSTSAHLGLGELRAVVPADVTVVLEARTGIGDVRLPAGTDPVGDAAPGQRVRRTLPVPPGTEAGGTLRLELNVSIGSVVVERAGS